MAYSELQKLIKNSIPAVLTSPISGTDTSIPVDLLERFYNTDSELVLKGIVLGYDNATGTYAEEIEITGASGTSGAGNITGATRGVNADGINGAAKAHDAGTSIAVMFSTGIYEQIRSNDQVFAQLPNRNKIINGNFAVNQEVVSGTVTLSAGEYGHDMWCGGASGCTYTFATSGGVTTLTISAGSLIQVIEGINIISDTYCLSWTGTAQGKIGAGSFSSSGVTGSVTGGTNLNIEFGTGTLSKVQLERGSYPTVFENRLIDQEVMLCQIYFRKSYNLDVAPGTATTVGLSGCLFSNVVNGAASTYLGDHTYFGNRMRTTPTITIWDKAGNQGKVSGHTQSGTPSDNLAYQGFDAIGETGFSIFTYNIEQCNIEYHYTADARLSP